MTIPFAIGNFETIDGYTDEEFMNGYLALGMTAEQARVYVDTLRRGDWGD
jgi:hypothetical protein